MTEGKSAQVPDIDRQTDLVLRLVKGEDIQALSEESGHPVATLSRWREEFLSAGRQRLAERTGGLATSLRVIKSVIWWIGLIAIVLIGGCVAVLLSTK